jgi:GT2 family glycosyltransferase
MMAEIDKKWAACIVYYQDQESLNNLLNSLAEQTLPPTEVFIADNNSNKQIDLKTFAFPIQLIRLIENKGFAAGANQAIKSAIKNNFNNLMLLSQDVLLDKNSAELLINQLNKSGGIVFPTMVNRNTCEVFSRGGKVSKVWGSIKLLTEKNSKNTDWADGSCLAFKSDVYEKVDGLNEEFFMYFEDVDFCYRAKQNGYELAHVETFTSQTPKGPSPKLRSRNSILFARRSKSILLKLSVTKRNLLASILLFARLRFKDSINRFSGILQGWKIKID